MLAHQTCCEGGREANLRFSIVWFLGKTKRVRPNSKNGTNGAIHQTNPGM